MKYLRMIKKQKGFTLIEVILTIIIAAIAGSMLVAYVNKSMIRSSQPLRWLDAGLTLNKIMENITSDYNNNPDITALSASVGGVGPQTNAYGTYTVVQNSYIEFDGGGNEIADTTDPCEMLKVTISDDTGQKFTSLFTGNVPVCP